MGNGADSYRRFLDGDDMGLADVMREYRDDLTLYLNNYLGNIHIAEEMAEDTFFRLMIKKPKFSGKSTFKSWLYAIGRHVTVDYLRHHSKEAPLSLEEAEYYHRESENPEEVYLTEERKRKLYEALATLSTEYRAVLWLIYFEEFSFEETAAALKKSHRQTANLLYRAKQSLKSKLEKEGFAYENL